MTDHLPTLFDPEPVDLPVLPYGGGSAWSGSDASRDRALEDDRTGVTGQRQRATLTALDDAGLHGLTWAELGHILNLHHGAASAVLSTLHRAGLICRLTARRGRSSVYVTHYWANGREQAEHMPNRSNRLLAAILTEIAADLDAGRVTTARARVHATLNEMETK